MDSGQSGQRPAVSVTGGHLRLASWGLGRCWNLPLRLSRFFFASFCPLRRTLCRIASPPVRRLRKKRNLKNNLETALHSGIVSRGFQRPVPSHVMSWNLQFCN